MHRGSSLLFVCLVLASCALPTATVVVSAQPAPEPEPEVAPSGPRHARIAGTIVLHADPDPNAPRIELAPGPGTANERVVELLESGIGWSRVRTLLPREAMAMGLDAGMGVAVLSLEGWVESKHVVEVLHDLDVSVPSSAASPVAAKPVDPMATATVVFAVRAGTRVHWPDGRVAGEVIEDHYFYLPAMPRDGQTPEGLIRMLCHERRTAPGLGVIQGWLCSSRSDVVDATFVDKRVAVALDEPQRPDPSGAVQAEGALDRDIIRRIVRAHINEVRTCYNEGLSRDPQLAGRVAINFVIKGDGNVGSAVVSDSNLSDPQTAQCIANAVQTWQFPKPKGGGNVIVTYPFNLEPG